MTSVENYGMQSAFNGCTSLTSGDLSSLSSAGSNGLTSAFYGCTSLRTVYLTRLSSVGISGLNSAFNKCTNLELVDFSEATAVPTMNNVSTFSNTNSTFKVVVPDSLYSTWIASTNWSNIASQIVRASDYTPAS